MGSLRASPQTAIPEGETEAQAEAMTELLSRAREAQATGHGVGRACAGPSCPAVPTGCCQVSMELSAGF